MTNINIDFSLSMPVSLALTDGSILVLNESRRVLPGRRLVARAQWQDREVYAKLFDESATARREFDRECAGAALLKQHLIAAPELLYTGMISERYPVMIYASLDPCQTAREALSVDAPETPEAGVQRLKQLLTLLAQHHAAGLYQQDMHLRNFLFKAGIVYTMDAGDIVSTDAPLAFSLALTNLVEFLSLIPAVYEPGLDELITCYFGQRALPVPDLAALRHRVRQEQYRRNRRYLDKLFRTSSAHVASRSFNRFEVVARDLPEAQQRALAGIQEMFSGPASFLKRGNSATVIRASLADRQVVIKRYNMKSLWHRLRRCLRPSRAAQSWRNAHQLLSVGIDTAQPLAMVESRFGPLRGRAWLVMDWLDAPHALDYFADADVSEEDKQQLAQRLVALLERLAQQEIVHGDLKATNFLVVRGRPVLIDLDPMQWLPGSPEFGRRFSRDLTRFRQNWQNRPESSLFNRLLEASPVLHPFL
ncbi:MAG: hypothetical protein OEZ10_00965 [Gammaproteobacteria bacterium]|nr:hypothetical protein [Gammaproteobacteria bacterium]